MFQVVDWEKDTADKFRFRVMINGNSVMFKFQDFPTDEEVQAEAQRYADLMQEIENGSANTGSSPNP